MANQQVTQQEFEDSCDYILKLGKKYNGKTLGEIGETDEGLGYLDWMMGTDWFRDPAKRQVHNYLNHSSVAPRINALVG